MVHAYVSVGSNIEPERNVREAIRALACEARVVALSTFYRTEPLGHPHDPQFINGVVAIETRLSARELKWEVLRAIESELGRRRGPDPDAQRTIDLDVLLYDGEPHDPLIERRAFLAWPLVELEPTLVLPDGRALRAIAERLSRAGMQALPELTAELRSEIFDGRTENRTHDQRAPRRDR
jgi:2-amino-4-hydroxy-6-hydroxymethyldihydropteridine diphosphokinase